MSGTTFTTTGTGVAAGFVDCSSGNGDFSLDFVWAGSAGSAKLLTRISGNTGWVAAVDFDNADIEIDKSMALQVAGGRQYTVNVVTHTSALTVRAGASS
jgi:hypothetical protein